MAADARRRERDGGPRPDIRTRAPNLPAWAQLQQDLRARGMLAPPVEVVDEDGEVLHALQHVLEVVADHGMLLATGHLVARRDLRRRRRREWERGVREGS